MVDPTGPTGELDNDPIDEDPMHRAVRRPDLLALSVGLISVVVAIIAFVGTVPPVPGFDPRWLLAAAAVAIGLMMLGASVRRRR